MLWKLACNEVPHLFNRNLPKVVVSGQHTSWHPTRSPTGARKLSGWEGTRSPRSPCCPELDPSTEADRSIHTKEADL